MTKKKSGVAGSVLLKSLDSIVDEIGADAVKKINITKEELEALKYLRNVRGLSYENCSIVIEKKFGKKISVTSLIRLCSKNSI